MRRRGAPQSCNSNQHSHERRGSAAGAHERRQGAVGSICQRQRRNKRRQQVPALMASQSQECKRNTNSHAPGQARFGGAVPHARRQRSGERLHPRCQRRGCNQHSARERVRCSTLQRRVPTSRRRRRSNLFVRRSATQCGSGSHARRPKVLACKVVALQADDRLDCSNLSGSGIHLAGGNRK